MSGTQQLLELLSTHGLIAGHLRGVLHIAIGRTVTAIADGKMLCGGVNWRELADVLQRMRLDREYGRDVGADPDTLHPKDRAKYWYAVIGLARVDSQTAREDAEKLTPMLAKLGYTLSAATGTASKLAELRPGTAAEDESSKGLTKAPPPRPAPNNPTRKKP